MARQDRRLSRMLHVLLHMAERQTPMTSAEIAATLDTHAALVRRTMSGLRDCGHVVSAKGRGGGWTLARPLVAISLLEVHEALGAPTLFSVGTGRGAADDASSCLLARAANVAIERALDDAEARFLQRLASVTVADLAAEFEAPERDA